MRRIVLGLAGVACLAAVGSVAARAQMPAGDQAKSAEVWVKAGITIDPEGRVTALHWEGKPKPALQAVQESPAATASHSRIECPSPSSAP